MTPYERQIVSYDAGVSNFQGCPMAVAHKDRIDRLNLLKKLIPKTRSSEDCPEVRGRAIAPSCHNAEHFGPKFVNRRSQHAFGLDARFARRVEPQQVHHDVANDGQVVGGIAAAYA